MVCLATRWSIAVLLSCPEKGLTGSNQHGALPRFRLCSKLSKFTSWGSNKALTECGGESCHLFTDKKADIKTVIMSEMSTSTLMKTIVAVDPLKTHMCKELNVFNSVIYWNQNTVGLQHSLFIHWQKMNWLSLIIESFFKHKCLNIRIYSEFNSFGGWTVFKTKQTIQWCQLGLWVIVMAFFHH